MENKEQSGIERLLHTQEVAGSSPAAPTTKPIIPLSHPISSDTSIGYDPLLATENLSSFGSHLAAAVPRVKGFADLSPNSLSPTDSTPENEMPESCAVSVQLAALANRRIISHSFQNPLGVVIEGGLLLPDGETVYNIPFVCLREATRAEFDADRGEASGPDDGPYFYEFTTD